jgi:hypothetical protein
MGGNFVPTDVSALKLVRGWVKVLRMKSKVPDSSEWQFNADDAGTRPLMDTLIPSMYVKKHLKIHDK